MEEKKKDYPPLTSEVIMVVDDFIKSEILKDLNAKINSEWLYQKGIWHRAHQRGFTPTFKSVYFTSHHAPFQIEEDIVKYYIIEWATIILANSSHIYMGQMKSNTLGGILKDVQVRIQRELGIQVKWNESLVKFNFDIEDIKVA